jgi:hypothetical protein
MKESIENCIEQIADKLPEFKHIRMDVTLISGFEMKLTGAKCDPKGQPFEDDAMYELQVPVVQPLDHKRSMRLAWLSHGLQGLYGYLDEYLSPSQLKQIKNHFMNANPTGGR